MSKLQAQVVLNRAVSKGLDSLLSVVFNNL